MITSGSFRQIVTVRTNKILMNVELLKSSVVGKDFLINDNHPDVDVFLDYRLRLKEKMQEGEYPSEWFRNEMQAVDEILRILFE